MPSSHNNQTVTDTTETVYVSEPNVESGIIEERSYQKQLVETAVNDSTLIALPTGTGKTAVAVWTAARRLQEQSGKVLMLAPTQPLVNQHVDFFRNALTIPDDRIKPFTGGISPEERKSVWSDGASVIVATPQVIENDLIGNRYTLDDVIHVIFDECHRATGDYAYVYIGQRCKENSNQQLVTGLSASPGTSEDDILDICSNLGLHNIEVLTEDDEELSKYLSETTVRDLWVDIPDPIIEASELVKGVYKDRLQSLKREGVIDTAAKDTSISALRRAGKKIHRLIDNDNSDGYRLKSIQAEAMKLAHGWRTIESQPPKVAIEYFEGIFDEAQASDGSKAAGRIYTEPDIRDAVEKLKEYDGTHPKFQKVHSEVARTLLEGGSALVFTDSRETAERITDYLNQHDRIDAHRFVGQRQKGGNAGMSQKEQAAVLEKFRNGEYDVLVSTSVAEEGLDIPAVDLVLFYSPVPDAIRNVQRRGRTGRESSGRVCILIGKNTHDKSAYFVSQSREKKMKKELNELQSIEGKIKEQLNEKRKQTALNVFSEDSQDATEQTESTSTNDSPATVYIDSRETKSAIAKELDQLEDIIIKLDTLDVADYVVSNDVAIERKTGKDFVQSITDGDRDIFTQIEELSNNYQTPILIIETEDGINGLYGHAQINKESIRSTLCSIAVDFDVRTVFTPDEKETARNLRTLARREQDDSDTEINPHGSKSTETLADSQVYAVSSFPQIGPVTARRLLDKFGDVYSVLTASEEELTNVEGVGTETATTLQEVIHADWSQR